LLGTCSRTGKRLGQMRPRSLSWSLVALRLPQQKAPPPWETPSAAKIRRTTMLLRETTRTANFRAASADPGSVGFLLWSGAWSGRSARSLAEARSLALRKRERREGTGSRSSARPREPRTGGEARSRPSGSDDRRLLAPRTLGRPRLIRVHRGACSGRELVPLHE